MEVNNDLYGGFVVSKNIIDGIQIAYSYRSESSISVLNGWTLYSEKDDDEYVNNSDNFVIINAQHLMKIAPVMLEIFDAPYSTDLLWVYEQGVHVGFYDLINEEATDIDKIRQK